MFGSSRTPASVEFLKKEAKRWLKALRANDAAALARFRRALPDGPPDPTLRDVQHALARERGFDGWTSFVAHAEQAPPLELREFERKAADLLAAYNTGAPDVMERHWRDAGHRRSWQATRTYIQLDLGRRPDVPGGDVEITLDDARLLVARGTGFESWRELADALSEKGIAAIDPRRRMNDAALAELARRNDVTALDLSGVDAITDDGIRHLAHMTQLRSLDLGGTRLTDRGLEALTNLVNLEKLSLQWTRVTDDGMRHLARLERLQSIDLSGTATGDRAVAAFANRPALTHFRSGNAVTDSGLSLFHEYPVFKTWHGGEVVLGLTSADAAPNMLYVRGPLTDRGFRALSGLNGLFGLSVDDSKMGLTAAALPPLVELPNLGFLAFDARDDAMPHIAAMPALRFLMCQDTLAGDDGFEALGASRSIEYIWGRRSHNLRDRGFRGLSRIPTLRALSTSLISVSDDALALLPEFPALRELMPMDVPDEGYRHIGRCTDLEALTLMYCRDTGDRATEHIANLPKLERYFNSYTRITDRTPELLSRSTSLRRIGLSACPGVTNQGVAALARMPSLQELDLGGMQNVSREVVALFPDRVAVKYHL